MKVLRSPLPRSGRVPPNDDGAGKARRGGDRKRDLTKPSSVAALSCLLLCLALLSGCALLGGSSTVCGQSPSSVEPSRAAPGETFRLHGGGFREGCNDTGPPFLREPARRDIRVEMHQGGKSWTLATNLSASGPRTTPST